MENIFVQSDKSYNQGFLITEQELRRLVDMISDQLKKVDRILEPELSYTIKFKNGVVATTEILTDIFTLENGGLGEIINFELKASTGKEKNAHEIKIEFKRENSRYFPYLKRPIEHSIKGKSRDWVFVTSSQIEERINKLKPPGISILDSARFNELIFAGCIFFIVFLSIVSNTFFKNNKSEYINDIETKWKANEITDPIEVLLIFEKNKGSLNLEPIKYVLMFFLVLIILYFLFKMFVKKYYPLYNFCWGDYLEEYNSKEKLRKNFIALFVIGILVSIIGGLVANYIGK
jgi:hypothetical protein